MFTGIVEELGRVVESTPVAGGARLRVRGPRVVSDAVHGASIAVNGVCLTVVEHDDETFAVDVMQESLDRSGLGGLAPGSPVNLERAMRADGRFGGHVVQGHVDGTGTCLAVTPGPLWTVVRVALPEQLARYVVEKGSITVDGTSLTVSALGDDADAGAWFEVSLIPTTLTSTTLGALAPGDRVNLEVDVLAKYVERLLAGQRQPSGAQAGEAVAR